MALNFSTIKSLFPQKSRLNSLLFARKKQLEHQTCERAAIVTPKPNRTL